MVTAMPDNCLLHWLQRLEDYPFTPKAALYKMYGYFKVKENDIGDENSSSTATVHSGSAMLTIPAVVLHLTRVTPVQAAPAPIKMSTIQLPL
jgi:hypothetical protein